MDQLIFLSLVAGGYSWYTPLGYTIRKAVATKNGDSIATIVVFSSLLCENKKKSSDKMLPLVGIEPRP